MLVIDRQIVLPLDCLLVGAEAAGVTLPATLVPEPVWRNPSEVQAHQNSVAEQLVERGLWRAGGPSEEFLRTITVLGRAGQAFSATVEASDGPYHVHVAASGRDAVLACHVPSSGNVVLGPARPEALAEDLVVELPTVSPGVGPALSVPESDLRDAMNGGQARRDVRRVLEVAGLPRFGGGQIYASYRDGLGSYRATGDSCCTFYDTDQGRYLFSFTEEPGYERYVNVAPGRTETLISKTYDLLEQLRHAR
ncbi:ESX secretion-associated protein EspG [Amycolatopsis sp. H20-H5]|uniref:ESX secretion-associated protein EspG n=1 Tax=Amycolatopsis sp. H20-H5 TaxID=3046309 RepID=UPI002DB8A420|nr:ESX secretion-associated protein EspG [Amycolatopsis sp. H20-H5]MEC3978188.1 ESX secretion-associated protein EspG [Amycolatopsis sp. H20-H5]